MYAIYKKDNKFYIIKIMSNIGEFVYLNVPGYDTFLDTRSDIVLGKYGIFQTIILEEEVEIFETYIRQFEYEYVYNNFEEMFRVT